MTDDTSDDGEQSRAKNAIVGGSTLVDKVRNALGADEDPDDADDGDRGD